MNREEGGEGRRAERKKGGEGKAEGGGERGR